MCSDLFHRLFLKRQKKPHYPEKSIPAVLDVKLHSYYMTNSNVKMLNAIFDLLDLLSFQAASNVVFGCPFFSDFLSIKAHYWHLKK